MNEKLEKQKERFKNHKATLTDYGNIKILDFQEPGKFEYRIRFLFEEDFYRLHISGDLGELTACNYHNMNFNDFGDFVHDHGYFEQKVCCHDRTFYCYDEDQARKELLEKFDEDDLRDFLYSFIPYDPETDDFESDFDEKFFEDFDCDNGIGPRGREALQEFDCDSWEYVSEIGKKETGIIDLYMLAFELATDQLKKKGVIE